MKQQIDPAFDAFVDDCLLEKDPYCQYPEENLELVASNIIQGIWQIKGDNKDIAA